MTDEEYEEYIDRRDEAYEYYAEEDHSCHVCGENFGKTYYIEGEWWCEVCMESKYYYNNTENLDETVFCTCCGEPVEGNIYCIRDGNGEDNLFCEECFYDIAENGECGVE